MKQTTMPLAGFEPANSGSEGPQTHVLDGVATGFGSTRFRPINMTKLKVVTHTHTYIYTINNIYISVQH
jgi:hypothetical protein